jgi:hypothetical protein
MTFVELTSSTEGLAASEAVGPLERLSVRPGRTTVLTSRRSSAELKVLLLTHVKAATARQSMKDNRGG